MIVNILDYREDRNSFNRIVASIMPISYPNSTRPDGTKFEITDDMPVFDTKIHISVKEAIEWANTLGFDVELGLEDALF